MSDVSDVRKDVTSIVRMYGKFQGSIPADKDLYADLGVESVNAISILLALETRFHTTIDDARFIEARTIDGLVDLVGAQEPHLGSRVA
ncbi:MAG: acyl carrier protein [Acidiferrobacter sp.]